MEHRRLAVLFLVRRVGRTYLEVKLACIYKSARKRKVVAANDGVNAKMTAYGIFAITCKDC
jgi:hypothetical protein